MKHEGPDPSSETREEDPFARFDAGQLGRVRAYEELLSRIAIPRGMVASGDGERLRERHVLDSLRGVPLLAGSTRVVDLGSGAGLPGVPIAIASPSVDIALAESRTARASFLDMLRDTLPLPNVRVIHSPVGQIREQFEVCLARAFAPPDRTWDAAVPLLQPGGRLLYWAGARFRETDVPREVSFEVVPTTALANAGPIVIMTRQ